ncbi:MAG: nitroreductase family protein [Candidatus Hecatellales archaeon]|nr:MAG: nitroreductase family protein [Candidatus Hecatellales archaeon]
MDFWEVLKGRRSIRRYQDKPLDDQVILKILDAARYAPSARNSQPWKFIVIRNRETLRKLSEIHRWAWFLKDAAAGIVCLADPRLSPRRFPSDVSCAVENMLLAAHALGVGACWVAVYSVESVESEEKVKAIVGIPEPYRVIAIVSLGWPAETPPPKSLRPLEEVVYWEKFQPQPES